MDTDTKLKNKFISSLYSRLTSGVSKDKDSLRREFILNILLLCSIVLSGVALIVTVRGDYFINEVREGNSSLNILVFLAIYLFGFWLSKKGKAKAVSFALIIFYFVVTSGSLLKWGPDFPMGLLIYALLIVMAGILISSRFAFFFTFTICLTVGLLIYSDVKGFIVFNENWRVHPATLVDIFVLNATFIIIAVVSWLFNSQGEKALRRARISEMALKKERDLLEIKVERKTRELRKIQAEKLTQLYRFAELGKMTSGIVHDLASSVNLVSMNLKELKNAKQKGEITDVQNIIDRATIGVKRLETYIGAASKQINNQDGREYFSINEEIKQVVEILNYKIRKEKIKINIKEDNEIKTFGNPVKFHQFLTNIISNAIDSYEGTKKKVRVINIELTLFKDIVELKVEDEGKGILGKELPHIFEPLFTTKGFKKGTGMGLSISASIIEKEFKGKIQVKSDGKIGSTFIIQFPRRSKV